MRPRKLASDQIDELVRLARTGQSHRKLGRRFGVSHTSVATYLERAGASAPSSGLSPALRAAMARVSFGGDP